MSKGPWRIGAVAKLVGVPAATIRTWERRYGVVEPGRTDGQDRVYDDGDVERLRRIAWLRERGERVSDLAPLPLDKLIERQSAHEGREEREATSEPLGVVRVAVVGNRPPAIGGVADGFTTVEVVATAAVPSALPANTTADVAVADLAALGTDPVATVRWLDDHRGISAVLVQYTFAPRQLLEDLVAAGVRTLRGPAANADIQQAVVDLARVRRAVIRQSTRQKFDRDTLQFLMHRPAELACECPNHIASLVISLSEFEQYSRECESRSPRDAELHARLARGTAHARALMETLLTLVQEQENLSIDE